MNSRFLWGVDLGGTKIEAVVLDADNNLEIIHRERVATEGHLGYNKVLHNINNLLQKISLEQQIPIERFGIGTPGSINPHTQELRNCNSVFLNGHPIQEDLERLTSCKVRVSNDANCFGISEFKLGIIPKEFPEAKSMFGVILGTGVGGAYVCNGTLVEGANRIGGEWGHNYLDNSGSECYCGKRNCVETILSGPALERYYSHISGHSFKLPEIVNRYRAGNDPDAERTMQRLYNFFAKAISVVINIIDPDVIVIGGGVGNIDELYTECMPYLKEFVFSDYINTKITKPLLGDSSGVLGAALLWD